MLQGIKMLLPIRRICDMQTVTSDAGSQYLLQMGGQGHPMHIHSLLPPLLLSHIPKKHLKCSFSYFLTHALGTDQQTNVPMDRWMPSKQKSKLRAT